MGLHATVRFSPMLYIIHFSIHQDGGTFILFYFILFYFKCSFILLGCGLVSITYTVYFAPVLWFFSPKTITVHYPLQQLKQSLVYSGCFYHYSLLLKQIEGLSSQSTRGLPTSAQSSPQCRALHAFFKAWMENME